MTSRLEDATEELRRLLAAVRGQEATAVSQEWLLHAREAMRHAGESMMAAAFDRARCRPEIQTYRRELLLLRDALEAMERDLQKRRISIREEQAHLKRTQAFVRSVHDLY